MGSQSRIRRHYNDRQLIRNGRTLSEIRHSAPIDARTDAAPPVGSVCILSRKDLRNITRVPRMAKALADAGFAVTVVSLGAPVAQLRALCPAVEYREVSVRPLTGKFLGLLNGRALRQAKRRERRARRRAERQAPHTGSAIMPPLIGIAALCRRLADWPRAALLAAPAALVLRPPGGSVGAAWRELAGLSAPAILVQLVRPWLQPRNTLAFARAADRATRDRRFDIVQAHDNYALAAAARLGRRDNARLVYDAVEISEHRLGASFNLLETLFERYDRRQEAAIFRRADAVVTVGQGLSDWYAGKYAIAAPRVVRNCRYFWDYRPDKRLRSDAGLSPETPLIVWFGGIYPQQGVETLIDVMPLLAPAVHLAIVAYALPRWASYIEAELPARAAALGVGGRVHFLPARDPEDLVPYVSGADLGVIPRPSALPNNFWSMPNKFLEMVMARLPIAASRLGDVVEAIGHYGIGQSFDESDLADMAAVLDRLLQPDVNRALKDNVMRAAEELTWEKESLPYVALVRSLARDGASAAKPRYARPAAPADAAASSVRSGAAMSVRNGTK